MDSAPYHIRLNLAERVHIKFRAVRFQIEEEIYETAHANLDAKEFSIEKYKPFIIVGGELKLLFGN